MVHSIHVDVEVDEPEAVEEDLKGEPVHPRCIVSVKVVRKSDC